MDPKLWLSTFKNSGDLSFKSPDDSADFARKSAEDGRRWVRERGFSIAEHYHHLRCEILLDVIPDVPAGHDASEGHFISKFIPFRQPDLSRAVQITKLASIEHKPLGIIAYSQYTLMFICSSKRRDEIKKIVPTEIRLEQFDKIAKLRIYALADIGDLPVDISGRLAEWEMDSLSISAAKKDCGISKSMIERMAEIIDDASRLMSQPRRYSVVEPKLQSLIASSWFSLSNEGITAFSNKSRGFGLEFSNAIISSLD
ncbi:hypothetical protein [Methylorubrum aminovorans]|uniref:hypothetical protein n=1 Tax=Methylorubrum aminovorans TaxID=269069 RepID=UPI003C30BC84